MTKEEGRAYSRGYWAGLRRNWPAFRPPHPPAEEVKALFDAADELRDAAFGVLSVVIPDEPVFLELKAKADAMDEAFAKVTAWLSSHSDILGRSDG